MSDPEDNDEDPEDGDEDPYSDPQAWDNPLAPDDLDADNIADDDEEDADD